MTKSPGAILDGDSRPGGRGAGTEPRTSTAALSKRVLDEYAAVRDSLPAEVVSAERRQEAIQALAARGLPTTRDENWRYTNLRPLERARFAPAAAPASAAPTPPLQSLSALPATLEGFARYTFVDGAYAPELSSPRQQTGLTVHSLRRITARSPQGSTGDSGTAGVASPATIFQRPRGLPALIDLPEARLALLNEAFATDSAAIHVTGKAAEPARVELLFITITGADVGTTYPRVQVSLDPGSRLVLVERHTGAAGMTSFVNSSV